MAEIKQINVGGITYDLKDETARNGIAQSDWEQKDELKPDFIKNKPKLIGRRTSEGGEIFNNASSAGNFAHAEGNMTSAIGVGSHAEGYGTKSSGAFSHVEGFMTEAKGPQSHSEGTSTIAAGDFQHVQGKANIEDTNKKYAHIVGNGQLNPMGGVTTRSNAHTLDWDGNAWYQGDVLVGGTDMDDPNAVSLKKIKQDLTNYYKKSETYNQTEINERISAIPKFAIEVVSSLPTENISTTTIYLKTTGSESENLYTEYIYVNSKWEKLGTQTVDLTGYVKKSDTGLISDLSASFKGDAYTPEGTVSTTIGTTPTSATFSGDILPKVNLSGKVSASSSKVVTGISTTPVTVNKDYSTTSAEFPTYNVSVGKPGSTDITITDTKPTASVENEILTLGSTTSNYTALKSVSAPTGSISVATEGVWPTAGTVSVISAINETMEAPEITIDNTLAVTGQSTEVSISGSYDKATNATSTFKGTAKTPTGTVTITGGKVTFA